MSKTPGNPSPEEIKVTHRLRTAIRYPIMLWYEFRSRADGLAILLTLLGLNALLAAYTKSTPLYTEGYIESLRFWLDAQGGVLAFVGLVHSAFCQSNYGYSLRPPWINMALPLRLHHLLAPNLLCQLGAAIALALVWGVARSILEVDAPYQLPLLLLTAVAMQGQAAIFWIGALGILQGAFVYATGFVVMGLGGFLLSRVGPFGPSTNLFIVLAIGGALWAYWAARALRSGWRMDSVLPAKLHRMSPIARRRKKSFSSPFWAQVWFEWRQCTMWLPILVGSGYGLSQAFGNHDSVAAIGLGAMAMFGVPVIIATAHYYLSSSYRRFVLARPLSSQRLGRAKWVALALAVLLTGLLTQGPALFWTPLAAVAQILTGYGSPDMKNVLMSSDVFLMQFVLSIYGLIAVGIELLKGFTDMPIHMLRLFPALIDTTNSVNISDLSPRNFPIPGADALSTILATVILCRWWASRLGTRLPLSREFWIVVVALLIPIVLDGLRLNDAMQGYAMDYATWVAPPITLAALFAYGLRFQLINGRDVAVGLTLFVFLFTLGGAAYTTIEKDSYLIDFRFGFWCVLLVSPMVWYPFVVSLQRYKV
mgnify:CR=1 FL=1